MKALKTKTYYFLLFLILGIVYNSNLVAQQSFVVDSLSWEKEVSKCDFSKVKEYKKTEEKDIDLDLSEPRSFDFDGMSSAFQTFAWIFIGIMILLLIYFILQSGGFKRNRSIKDNGEWLEKIEQIEEDLENKDLNYFIKQALKEEAYGVAIRLKYLLAIQQLNEAGAIVWKRQKTNGEYLRELNSSNYFISFKKATLTFEFVWYSDNEFTKSSLLAHYESITANVDSILLGIKQETNE